MADYKITLDEKVLQGLFGKDGSLARLVSDVLNPILKAQVAEHLQAQPYERTDIRTGQRNGVRSRKLVTRVGAVELDVPQVRGTRFYPVLFERYQRSEQAFMAVLMEMVINGVSTRKVQRITQELCGHEFSKSTVSDVVKELDPLVDAWRNRPLNDEAFPFVLVDATMIKVRKDGRVRQQSLLTATGIAASGTREILGFAIDDSESSRSWGDFFAGLKQRGLHGVDLVVSDQHAGLVQAVRTHFQGASWQRCQTHLMRNIMDVCPEAEKSLVRERIRVIFNAVDEQSARNLANQFVDEFHQKVPKVTQKLEEALDDAIAVLALPPKYHRQLRTTNTVERLNSEIHRRERVFRVFPNMASAVRLIGAILMELDEEYQERRYFDMKQYWDARARV